MRRDVHSLKPKVKSGDPLELQLLLEETRAPSLPLCKSYVTMLRWKWEFSNWVKCNTRSTWCRLKPSLSVCILNASQSKSKPVCAALVCSPTITPLVLPGPAILTRKRSTQLQETQAWCENILYCVKLSLTLCPIVILVDLITDWCLLACQD